MLPLELTLKQNITLEERSLNKPQPLQHDGMFRNHTYAFLLNLGPLNALPGDRVPISLTLGITFSCKRDSSHIRNISNRLSRVVSRQRRPLDPLHSYSTHRNVIILKQSSSMPCVQVCLRLEKGISKETVLSCATIPRYKVLAGSGNQRQVNCQDSGYRKKTAESGLQ